MGRAGLNARVRRVHSSHAAILGAVLLAAATGASAREASAARGGMLLKRHCAGCHASGIVGTSPLAAAPPLRELHRRYEPEFLAEALAEGIVTGHPAMPPFRFEPHDVRSIVLYLNQIQDRRK